MSSLPLTARQERLLRIIETSIEKKGYVPTLQEMAQAMSISSLQGVKDHLAALERKGYIRRSPGRRRAIEILQRVVQPEGNIPIIGRVAAGRPLLAIENQQGTLNLSAEFLGTGTHFALKVQGDSMIGAGIQEGDYVIVRHKEAADPGAIVVALLGEEVTVKRLKKKGKSLLLEAANPAYAPIPLTQTAPSPRVVGVVVGLYRDFEKKH